MLGDVRTKGVMRFQRLNHFGRFFVVCLFVSVTTVGVIVLAVNGYSRTSTINRDAISLVPFEEVQKTGMLIGMSVEQAEKILGLNAIPLQGPSDMYVFYAKLEVGYLGYQTLTLKVQDGAIETTSFIFHD